MTKASLSQKSKGEDFTVPDLKLHHKATVAQSGTKTDVQTSGLNGGPRNRATQLPPLNQKYASF